MAEGVFIGNFETYTRCSWVADEEKKKQKKVLGVFNGIFWVALFGGIVFLMFLKGDLKKSFGNPDLFERFFNMKSKFHYLTCVNCLKSRIFQWFFFSKFFFNFQDFSKYRVFWLKLSKSRFYQDCRFFDNPDNTWNLFEFCKQ